MQPPREVVNLDEELAAATVEPTGRLVAMEVAAPPVQRFASNSAGIPADGYTGGYSVDPPPAAIGPQADPFCESPDDWGLYCLPDGLIYRNYLAGPKESRLGMQLVHSPHDSDFFDSTLGAHVGFLRYGNSDPYRPRGFQIDFEGSAQLRQDIREDLDVVATDYRAGVPLTWGNERHQFKFAWYHCSSHLGDEFFLKNPNFPLHFQSSDYFVLGYSFYWKDTVRLYGEAGWAYKSVARDPWEFQFGAEWAPRSPTGLRGAPFAAANAYLRQELNYGGVFTFQCGWAWRSINGGHLFRMGFDYYNGVAYEFTHAPMNEQLIGAGIWYDF